MIQFANEGGVNGTKEGGRGQLEVGPRICY